MNYYAYSIEPNGDLILFTKRSEYKSFVERNKFNPERKTGLFRSLRFSGHAKLLKGYI